jgi:hypothetical protein
MLGISLYPKAKTRSFMILSVAVFSRGQGGSMHSEFRVVDPN